MKSSFAQQRSRRSTTPRVALLIETSREFGRGLLRGIHAYEQRHGPWRLYVMPGDLKQILPTMRVWHATGIIAQSYNKGSSTGYPHERPAVCRRIAYSATGCHRRSAGGGAKSAGRDRINCQVRRRTFAGTRLPPFCLCGRGERS